MIGEKRSKNFKWFIGIDVSKNKVDVAVLRDSEFLMHHEIANSKTEIHSYCHSLKTRIEGFRMANALFCMEHTSFYCGDLIKVLYKAKASFALENALRIKRSSGLTRGKDDRGDAIRIAVYASRFHSVIKLWQPCRPVIEDLKFLIALRNRLMETSIGLKHPLVEQESFVSNGLQRTLKALCEKTTSAIDTDKKSVELAIDNLIVGDTRLNRLIEIITSVSTVGRITAIYFILLTNEFISISCPNKFACYAGVAPFKFESGKMKKKGKVSPISNRKMKSLLHMCAIGALRRCPELKAYYERKVQTDGKAKMAIINAIRYKLILRVFACVREDRLYADNYVRPQKSEIQQGE